MTSQPARPGLTRQFCFSTVALRDFLRLSRAVDDTITQSLNALVTPALAGFDPHSTAVRGSVPSLSSYASSAAPSAACRTFRDSVLFPAWQARDDVIRFCGDVAEAAMAPAATNTYTAGTPDDASPAAAPTPVDPRLTERYDPYIRRRQFSEVEPAADRLAALMRQEHIVEQIVRARSWDVLQGRCGGDVAEGRWEAALERWQAARR